MTVDELRSELNSCPLIVSAQAPPGSPLDRPDHLVALASASLCQGVRIVRAEGAANIAAMAQALRAPIIGLIKRHYVGSPVYITPTAREVDEAVAAGCAIIALDGTARNRPEQNLETLVATVKRCGALALADVDGVESAKHAVRCGADLVSTTLCGYTGSAPMTPGPDLDALRRICEQIPLPVLAEGRFSSRAEVQCALRIGAGGVVVGGAINDPLKRTAALMPSTGPTGNVGAVDIGGTWLRFAVFSPRWEMIGDVDQVPNPPNRASRLQWIRDHARNAQVERLGVSTGGIVDPATGEVWKAKEHLMPDHVGVRFHADTIGVATMAHGDGHAAAWGHAMLPQWAGSRIATLTVGTGVGCGFVCDGRIWCGRRGEYPRLNDLPATEGHSFEAVMGGKYIGEIRSESAVIRAGEGIAHAVQIIRSMYMPDAVVVAGSVGLSEDLRTAVEKCECERSPFGSRAGLYGAAALALFPPDGLTVD